MEKLTLDQLEVEYFGSQLNEEELSHLKGGTSATCFQLAITQDSAVAGASGLQLNSHPPICKSLIPPLLKY